MSTRSVTFDPPTESLVLALGSGVLTVALTAFGSFALPVGVLGLVLLGVGTSRGVSSLTHAGGGLLGSTVLLAGFGGVPVVPTLLAGIAAIVAWDASVDVGIAERYDTDGTAMARRSGRIGAMALVAGIWCFLTYRLAAGGRPTVALLALVVGAFALVAALDRPTDHS